METDYSLCLVLLRMGFTQPTGHPAAGELLPHHFALTRQDNDQTHRSTFCMIDVVGRYVSAALSLELPPLDVIQHSALWSSDFPRTLRPAIACFPQTYLASVTYLRSLIKRCAFSQKALQCRYHIRTERLRIGYVHRSADSSYIARQLCRLSIENGSSGPGAGSASTHIPYCST
jgi:hypothetical protein